MKCLAQPYSSFLPRTHTLFSGVVVPDALGPALVLAMQKLLQSGLGQLGQGVGKAVHSSGSRLLAEFHPPEICTSTG